MENYFSVEAMVQGYHVYKEVWDINIGERPLACETGNFYEFDVLFCNPEEIFTTTTDHS